MILSPLIFLTIKHVKSIDVTVEDNVIHSLNSGDRLIIHQNFAILFDSITPVSISINGKEGVVETKSIRYFDAGLINSYSLIVHNATCGIGVMFSSGCTYKLISTRSFVVSSIDYIKSNPLNPYFDFHAVSGGSQVCTYFISNGSTASITKSPSNLMVINESSLDTAASTSFRSLFIDFDYVSVEVTHLNIINFSITYQSTDYYIADGDKDYDIVSAFRSNEFPANTTVSFPPGVSVISNVSHLFNNSIYSFRTSGVFDLAQQTLISSVPASVVGCKFLFPYGNTVSSVNVTTEGANACFWFYSTKPHTSFSPMYSINQGISGDITYGSLSSVYGEMYYGVIQKFPIPGSTFRYGIGSPESSNPSPSGVFQTSSIPSSEVIGNNLVLTTHLTSVTIPKNHFVLPINGYNLQGLVYLDNQGKSYDIGRSVTFIPPQNYDGQVIATFRDSTDQPGFVLISTMEMDPEDFHCLKYISNQPYEFLIGDFYGNATTKSNKICAVYVGDSLIEYRVDPRTSDSVLVQTAKGNLFNISSVASFASDGLVVQFPEGSEGHISLRMISPQSDDVAPIYKMISPDNSGIAPAYKMISLDTALNNDTIYVDNLDPIEVRFPSLAYLVMSIIVLALLVLIIWLHVSYCCCFVGAPPVIVEHAYHANHDKKGGKAMRSSKSGEMVVEPTKKAETTQNTFIVKENANELYLSDMETKEAGSNFNSHKEASTSSITGTDTSSSYVAPTRVTRKNADKTKEANSADGNECQIPPFTRESKWVDGSIESPKSRDINSPKKEEQRQSPPNKKRKKSGASSFGIDDGSSYPPQKKQKTHSSSGRSLHASFKIPNDVDNHDNKDEVRESSDRSDALDASAGAPSTRKRKPSSSSSLNHSSKHRSRSETSHSRKKSSSDESTISVGFAEYIPMRFITRSHKHCDNEEEDCPKDDLENILLTAIKARDTERAKFVIEQDHSIIKGQITVKQSKTTPLLLSCKYDSYEIAKLLLKSGAPLNVKEENPDNKNDLSPLDHAVMNGNMMMAELLISYNADINSSKSNMSPLQHAFKSNNVSFVKFLLDNGADLNRISRDGKSAPLIDGLKYSSHDLNERIFKRYADIIRYDIQDGNGDTPLHLAIRNKYYDIIDLIVSRFHDDRLIHIKNKQGRTPFLEAVELRDITAVRTLLRRFHESSLEDKFPNGDTAMHHCVNYSLYDIAKLLVDFNMNPKAKDKNGKTPVEIATTNNDDRMVSILRRR